MDSIYSRSRASHDVHSVKLYNCDVCWTCKFFDFGLYGCNMYNYDYPMEPALVSTIEEPTWFRCSYWEERDES